MFDSHHYAQPTEPPGRPGPGLVRRPWLLLLVALVAPLAANLATPVPSVQATNRQVQIDEVLSGANSNDNTVGVGPIRERAGVQASGLQADRGHGGEHQRHLRNRLYLRHGQPPAVLVNGDWDKGLMSTEYRTNGPKDPLWTRV